MKRAAVVGLIAGATVVALAAVGGWWLLSRPQSPEDAANAYLEALARGDYPAIADMRSADPDSGAETLIQRAFAGASAYVSDARIEELDVDHDGTAAVRADVALGGERRELFFMLEASAGRWHVVGDHLARMRIEPMIGESAGGDSVWIGDALAPAYADIAVLPAQYEVQAAPRGILTGSTTVAVSNDEPAVVPLETALSPEATAAAQERLDAYADACAQPAESVPDQCGLRVPWAVDLGSLERIAFRIEQRPTVALAHDGSGFDATGGVIVATVTGTTRAGRPGTFTYRADDWALRGSLRFEGDEMVLAVR